MKVAAKNGLPNGELRAMKLAKPDPMKIQHIKAFLVFCGCALLVTGCRLVAPYDSQLDKGVSDLQESTEAFLVKVARQGGSSAKDYGKFTDFYDQEKVAISGLEIRAGVLSNNSRSLQEIEKLKSILSDMENRHKTNGLNAIDVDQFDRALTRVFRAILTLEIAKKEPSSGGGGGAGGGAAAAPAADAATPQAKPGK